MISLFDRRALMQYSEELKKPQKFLTQTFFTQREAFASGTVDLDIYKGSRRTAAYVRRYEAGTHVEKIGFTTQSFQPPVLKPKKMITALDIDKRQPGQGVYSQESNFNQYVKDFVAKEIADLNDIIERNEEWQAKQALFEGKVAFYNDNAQKIAEIDYGRDSSLIQTLSTKWDATGADILGDLREYRRKVAKLSGYTPRLVLLGTDAADEFLSNQAVKDALNKDFSLRGVQQYDMRDNGGIFYGSADGFDIWGFEDYIIDPSDDTEKLVIPEKKVLVAAAAPATRVYGAVDVATNEGLIIEATERYLNAYSQDDPAGWVVQLHSTPLMVTNHPNAYATLTVLT